MGNRNFNFNWEFKNFAIRTVHENWEDRNSPLRKNCPIELIKYFEARYPGDKFSCATEEERDKCKEIMERTLKQLQPFIEGYDFSNEPLLSMDSF